MCYNQIIDISTQDGTSLKLVDKFTYLGSSVSSTEKDIDTRLTKAWTAIYMLSIIWKSDLTDKMKRSFFQAAVVSILLYGCTTWTLNKQLEKKQYWTSPGGNTPQGTNYTATCLSSRKLSKLDEPDMLEKQGRVHKWCIPMAAYGRAKAVRPARTYIQQLCEDTGCRPEDLPEAMNDREKWRERVRDICASGTT